MRAWLSKAKRTLQFLVMGEDQRDYKVLDSPDIAKRAYETRAHDSFSAWHDQVVARRQHAAYTGLIEEMYGGRSRQDLVVAAEAVSRTGVRGPMILEVGCGSGYYSEILTYLLGQSIHYIGIDYSETMVSLARQKYPERPFMLGDATALPFADGTLDIVMNGVSLMHIVDYKTAIAEARRVAARWCIFHTVPILRYRKTTFLQKRVYGEPGFEVIFNEAELHQILEQRGLIVRQIFESVPYDLKLVVGEPTVTKTYVCEVKDE